MRVVWAQKALEDLAALQIHIAADSPAASRRVGLRLVDIVTELLISNPHMGRPGRIPGTRELVVSRTPYIIPYRILNDTVEVVRIYHGAQRWPDRL